MVAANTHNMHTTLRRVSLGLAVFALVLISQSWSQSASAATAPALGSTSAFGIVSGTSTNANTAPQTIINGSVCGTTLTVPRPLTITGGAEETPCAPAKGIDQGAALATINGQACTPITGTLNGVIVGGNAPGTFPPGCYAVTGAMDITTGTTVTLDATAPGGDGGSVWIFKSTGAFTTGASTAGFPNVALANGASAANVFWAPAGATTIGANFALSATPTFVGTIIDDAGISLGHFANLLGRALNFATTVTTDANTITVPTTLTLRKTVINNNGGTAVAGAWTLSANGPTAITGAHGSAAVTGAAVTPGLYTLSESGGPSNYTASTYSCAVNGGAAVVSNTITLAAGDSATCTITNDDFALVTPSASINVVKVVINDNGGTKTISDFTLSVDDQIVGSGITNTFPSNTTHTVTETGNAGYTQTFSADCNAAGVVSLLPGDNKVCIITNDDIAPSVVPAPVVPPVPPLIDVVKVPSPLALPAGPGLVNYTYTLRNIGTVPVTNITMVGDTCIPITLTSGDANANARLEVTETWVYNCATTLQATHTNTVVATGWANGLSAVDIASATVVVGVPEIVPPLIHITKVPSPLALRAGGGMVNYIKKVTNPGTVALSNVRLVDDKFNPVAYISGDLNNDSRLDPTETWTYTCRVNLTRTTTNTVIVTGEANGLVARDFAIATVVVAPAVTIAPALPKTGFAPAATKKVGIPMSIRIPRLGVNALVEKVTIAKDGSMGAPKSAHRAGWFELGVRPGESGNAAIGGHLNTEKGGKAAFTNLHKAKKGDKITVKDDKGKTTSFVVSGSKKYKATENTNEVFVSKDGKARLNLITCDGAWDEKTQQYSQRLVVFADKV